MLASVGMLKPCVIVFTFITVLLITVCAFQCSCVIGEILEVVDNGRLMISTLWGIKATKIFIITSTIFDCFW